MLNVLSIKFSHDRSNIVTCNNDRKVPFQKHEETKRNPFYQHKLTIPARPNTFACDIIIKKQFNFSTLGIEVIHIPPETVLISDMCLRTCGRADQPTV